MSSRLISVPFTVAHTSAAWCSDCLHPARTDNTSPATGKRAPARRNRTALLVVLGERVKGSLRLLWSPGPDECKPCTRESVCERPQRRPGRVSGSDSSDDAWCCWRG